MVGRQITKNYRNVLPPKSYVYLKSKQAPCKPAEFVLSITVLESRIDFLFFRFSTTVYKFKATFWILCGRIMKILRERVLDDLQDKQSRFKPLIILHIYPSWNLSEVSSMWSSEEVQVSLSMCCNCITSIMKGMVGVHGHQFIPSVGVSYPQKHLEEMCRQQFWTQFWLDPEWCRLEKVKKKKKKKAHWWRRFEED